MKNSAEENDALKVTHFLWMNKDHISVRIKSESWRVFRFVNLLLSQMSVEELREEACDCLFEIINKGMDPVDKTKLVESLCRVLQSAGFFNVEQVRVWSDTQKTVEWKCFL